MNILIGQLEDNVLLVTYHYLMRVHGAAGLKWLNYPFGGKDLFQGTTQPLVWELFKFLSLLTNEIFVYNAFVLLSFVLTVFTTYKLFNYLIHHKVAAVLGASVFAFSPYFYYQARSHIELIQYWVVVLFIYHLLKSKSFKDYLASGIILAVTALTSSYLGFIGLLFCVTHFFAKLVVNRYYNVSYRLDKTVVGHFAVGMLSLLLVFIFVVPHLKVSQQQIETTESTQFIGVPKRPFEDFVDFAAKPWFYILPSVDHPISGHITENVLSVAGKSWGYFWLNNYFKSEHSASYLGIVNTGVIAALLFLVFKKRKTLFNRQNFDLQRSQIISLCLIAGVFFALSLPPMLTFNNKVLYLPSYVIWKYLPMFRVLARLSSIVVLVYCLGVAQFYKYLLDRKKYFVVGVLFILSIVDFFIPIKLVNYSNPPKVYTYIAQNTPSDAVIAVYPHSELTSALFWMREFNRPFVNPRDFIGASSGFNSKSFTEKLNTCGGLLNAKNLGVTHIVYWGDAPASKPLVTFDAVDDTPAQSIFARIVIVATGAPNSNSFLYEIDPLYQAMECTDVN